MAVHARGAHTATHGGNMEVTWRHTIVIPSRAFKEWSCGRDIKCNWPRFEDVPQVASVIRDVT